MVSYVSVQPDGIIPIWKKPYAFLMTAEMENLKGSLSTIGGGLVNRPTRGRNPARQDQWVTEGRILWAELDESVKTAIEDMLFAWRLWSIRKAS
jgi:hypothetical protein